MKYTKAGVSCKLSLGMLGGSEGVSADVGGRPGWAVPVEYKV